MSRFTHPRLDDVSLPSALHALSDAGRLEIVRRLDDDARRGGEGLSCGEAACSEMPRASMSNHFNVLRAAGMVESRKEGVRVLNRLRRSEIDARFPGLLDAVLEAKPVAV